MKMNKKNIKSICIKLNKTNKQKHTKVFVAQSNHVWIVIVNTELVSIVSVAVVIGR